MKKRILSFLLLLCMVASLIPTALFPVAAESGSGTATQSTPDGYTDLYVGANGEATKNGGTLSVLLTAFKGGSSLDMANNAWTNLAKNATKHATFAGSWTAGADGGVGYDLAAWDYTYTLSMDASLLPTDTYTLEIVSSVRGLTVNAEGVTPVKGYQEGMAGLSLGRLRGFLWCGDYGSSRLRDKNGMIVMYTENPDSSTDTWSKLCATANMSNNAIAPHREDTSIVNMTVTLTNDADYYYYSFLKNGDTCPKDTYFASKCAKADTPYVGSFILNRSIPGTMYAVRLYTKPLTEAELLHNRAVDILLHTGVAFSVYQNVPDADKDDFLALVAKEDFTATEADILTIVENLEQLRAEEAAKRQMSVYDELYIGADGSKSENGGSLSVLLTAYGSGSLSFTDTKNVWYDKMGNHDATLVGSLWHTLEGGGVGYELNVWASDAKKGTYTQETYLDLGIAALPTEDFTVEYVAKYKNMQSVDADGNILGDYSGTDWWGGVLSDAVGQLKVIYDRSEGTTLSGRRGCRWFLSPGAGDWYDASYNNQQLWYDSSRNDTTVFTQQLVRDLTVEGGATLATYKILKNSTTVRTGNYNSTTPSAANSNTYYTGAESETLFYLFRRTPVNVYAVRVYDAVLTEYEMAYNHFIDLLAYAEADPALLTNLDAESRAFVIDAFKKNSFSDREAFIQSVEETVKLITSDWNADTSLYVTDGLQVLLSSYKGFSTATRFGETSVLWANAVKDATFGTLMGKGWYRAEDGGLRIVDSVPQLVVENQEVEEYRKAKANEFYLSLDYDMLPDGDYTLETVLTPDGLTVEDEAGNLTSHYDEYTQYGINHDGVFVLGAFRCMGFVCNSHAGNANMQRRWMYRTSGGWGSAGRVQIGTDNVLATRTLGKIVNYSITHDRMEDNEEGIASAYTVTLDGKRGMFVEIPKSDYIANEDVEDQRFDVWRYMAGSYYSIRVYDRLLSEAEILQNRVADVCYYLGLDTSMLEETLSKIPDKTTVFKAFAHFNFEMSKEQAQSDLDNGMAGIWVLSEDVAIKSDMSDTIRFYFTLQYPSIAAIMQAGFKVELGTLVNTQSDSMPVLESGAYDYRFIAFDSVAGAHTRYFLDEDTYAITLTYENADIDLYNQKLKVITYVKLTTASGDDLVFYGSFTGKEYGEITSFFSVMNHLSKQESIKESELVDYVNNTVENCYYDHTVYFDSYAEGKGDGSENAPYTDFADAFEACNTALKQLDKPTNVRLFVEGGIHSVTEIAEFDFDEISYPYYYYTIEGNYMADEAPELTTTLPLASSDFTAVAGKTGLYVYEFAPDENGSYPVFRNLYVNDELALRAANSSTAAASGVMPYFFAYDRDLDGTYLKAKYYFEQGVLADHSPEVEYASLPERTDLIAAYTAHYQGFLAEGASYAAPAVDEENREARFYVHLDMIRPLQEMTAERLAELRNNKASYESEVARITALLAEKQAAYNAAKADYQAALEAAGKADATDEEKVAYIAAKAVMEAAEATVTKTQAMLAAAEEKVYDATLSYKTCLKGLQIELHTAANWCFDIMDIDGIDFDDVVYYYDKTAKKEETLVAVYLNKTQYAEFALPDGNTMANRLYSVQNALPFVDEEGEYYYDEETGKLYFYTEEDMETLSLSYPTQDNMLVFRNANHLVISDLTFWGVDDSVLSKIGLAANQAGQNSLETDVAGLTWFSERAAIALHDTDGATIQDCYIHDIGGSGLYLQGRTENVVISGNEIENVGECGIRFRGCYAPWGGNREFSERSGVENVVIKQNYLHKVAQVNFAAVGIYLPSCKDVEIANNTIIGCSYSGMSIGWNWSAATWEEGEKINLYNVEIHHNYITDFMQELGDGGAIYMLGGNLKPENPKLVNFIHHNFVVCSKLSGNGLREFAACYYFDGSSTSWANYNNIAVEHSAGADRGAKAGASEADYRTYLRRAATNVVYKQLQNIAYSYNIHSYNNYFYNVRATTASRQQNEVFVIGTNYAKRGHQVYNNNYFFGENKLSFSTNIKALIEETGANAHPGEWEWLLSNEY